MEKHFVSMKLTPGTPKIELKAGQVIDVFMIGSNDQKLPVPMTVLKVYENGDFDGEVVWEEA